MRFLILICLTAVILPLSAYADSVSVNVPVSSDSSAQMRGSISRSSDGTSFSAGAVLGSVNIDGVNYQQIGLQPVISFGKFSAALDLDLLFDENGKIRTEDWDEWKDYPDKISYIKYGSEGDPFFIKIGRIDSVTLGNGIILSGYRNTTEYPSYKRIGLDAGFETSVCGARITAGDFKELRGRNKALMGGGRFFVKPFTRLQVGASLAGDLNEYKGLHDRDDDGVPDRIDEYPDDKRYATLADYYADHGVSQASIDELVSLGIITKDAARYNDMRSRTGFWAGDADFLVFNGSLFKMNVYGQFAQSVNKGGWGCTVPGVRFRFSDVLELYGDYRFNSKKFIFGYYNETYDIQRAGFVLDGDDKLAVVTKKDELDEAPALRGFLAGIKLNIFDVLSGRCEYHAMDFGTKDRDKTDHSIRADLELKKDIAAVSGAGIYYVQNNVDRFRLKNEGVIWGAFLGIKMSDSVRADIRYTVTYTDRNGDGRISGTDETNTNIGLSTTAVF